MTLIRNRLLPFFPSEIQERALDTISADELPDDIEWKQVGGGMELGRAESQSDCFFQRFGENTYRHRWSRPHRQFFLERLVRSFAPYMRFNLMDYWGLGDFHDPDKVAAAFFEWNVIFATEGPDSAETKQWGKEYPSAILSSLEQLAVQDGGKDVFDTGRLFGTLVAELESFCAASYSALEDDKKIRRQLLDFIDATIESLKEKDLVRRNHFAEAALEDIIGCTTDKTDAYYESATTIANRHLMNVWLAVGELLGVLRDADEITESEYARSLASRTSSGEDESPDQIETRLRLAESDLAKKGSEEGIPEYCVAGTGSMIESLMKMVWPQEFQEKNNENTNIPSILLRSIRDRAKPLHRRFASIAMSLYQCYRNPSAHEATFTCSYDEATFFVSGLRTLVDLSRRIQEEKT